jgi:hypothetical protein
MSDQQASFLRSARYARGLFRLWLVLSCIWIAIIGLILWSGGSSNNSGKPGECVAAKTAEECANILGKVGKNRFAAFGTVGNEPVYNDPYDRSNEEQGKIVAIAGLLFLPPGLLLIIGADLHGRLGDFDLARENRRQVSL